MKKSFIVAMLLSLFVTPLASQAITQDIQEKGFISVSTSENIDISPDVAEISFAVKTDDVKSLQNATKTNKEISDKLYADLSSMLVVEDGDYIKTSDYRALPVYSYSNNKRNFEKYEVSNRIMIHTKSIDKVGKIIDKAISLGATNVDSLNFSVSNYDNVCDDLLSLATKKAYNRANLIAKSSSSTLDGIKSLNVSCSSNNYGNTRMYMARNVLSKFASDSAPAEAETTINGGLIKIYANVNASYFVK